MSDYDKYYDDEFETSEIDGDEDMKIVSNEKSRRGGNRNMPEPDDGKTRIIDRSEIKARSQNENTDRADERAKRSQPQGKKENTNMNGRYRKYTRQEKKKYMKLKKKQQNGCLRKILYIIVLFTFSIVLSFYAVKVSSDMFGLFQEDSAIEITIPEGATDEEVVTILKSNNIIENEWAFKLYRSLKKDSRQNVGGVYVLNRKDDYGTIISTIKGAYIQREEIEVVIPEGYTFEQICNKLEESGVCSAADMRAYADKVKDGYKFLDIMPDNDDIIYRFEGYMFPDTYAFYSDSPASSVYAKFLTNMQEKYTDEYAKRADKLGMSMHEVLTLASIIQKEAGNIEEMKKVSSVFHNRLNSSSLRMLQSDVTVWYPYATKEEVEDLNAFKGTYNTYDLEGLPPGPVCNPGADAIEAALYPDDTGYYYFVTDKNNKYYYAYTFEEHQYNCNVAESVGVAGGTDTE